MNTKRTKLNREVHSLQDANIVLSAILLFGVYEGKPSSEECMNAMVSDCIELIKADVEPWYIAMSLEQRFPKCSTEQYEKAIWTAIDSFKTGVSKMDKSARKELLTMQALMVPTRCLEAGILDKFYGKRV
ncbi:MAG: hypothetical protein NC453_14895 [Muribaculum sp.]|nr:hypothetical protein [Muribaculum sp.]